MYILIIKMKLLFIIFSVLLVLLFARLWVGQGSSPDIWYLEKQIDIQNEANDQQSEKNRQLEAEVTDLQSGDDAIEEYARDELGMIRKGEKFYHVILNDKKPKTAEKPAASKAINFE